MLTHEDLENDWGRVMGPVIDTVTSVAWLERKSGVLFVTVASRGWTEELTQMMLGLVIVFNSRRSRALGIPRLRRMEFLSAELEAQHEQQAETDR